MSRIKHYIFIPVLIIITMGLFNKCKQNQTFESDKFTTGSNKTLTITFLKHASLMMSLDNFVIYLDPVSKQDDITIDFSVLPKADLILVTHEHFDHLDTAAIKILSKDGTRVYASKNAAMQVGNANALKPGDNVVINDVVSFRTVPAYNISPEQLKFHPKDRGDIGFVITLDDKNIYVPGDVEDIPEMASLSDIDIAFIPVNQPYTMKIEQAVRAAKMINPKILYPYHFSDTDINELVNLLSDTHIEVRIRNMQ